MYDSLEPGLTVPAFPGGRPYRRVLGSCTLRGDRVVNSQNEDLGEIKELMIDVIDGRVAYAVLSFGGFMGIGDKLFAVPWRRIHVDQDHQCFVLNVDRRTLEFAPGFDKDDWPDMSDPAWGAQINDYYVDRDDVT